MNPDEATPLEPTSDPAANSATPNASTPDAGRPPMPGSPIQTGMGDRPVLNLSPYPSVPPMNVDTSPTELNDLEKRVAELRQEEQRLRRDIDLLRTTYSNTMRDQVTEAQSLVSRLVKEGLGELEQRKQALQLSIEQLERRQERIRAEMRTTFAGTSQDLAIRVQGFKDYLVGSLQDLATSAEQLQLATPKPEPERRSQRPAPSAEPQSESAPAAPRFAEQAFQEQTKQIRRLLDQYRTSPDYYGPAWRLRRTFEPVHAERVSNWFFSQGGRGAQRTMGSRLQNILIASAAISILRDLFGDRLRTLILADSPERLGEWRRGLQDCLGISRADFGSDQGVVLFEAPEPLAQRAERLVKQKQIPLIIVDESEPVISLALLQFPLWLAFAPDPNNPMVY